MTARRCKLSPAENIGVFLGHLEIKRTNMTPGLLKVTFGKQLWGLHTNIERIGHQLKMKGQGSA